MADVATCQVIVLKAEGGREPAPDAAGGSGFDRGRARSGPAAAVAEATVMQRRTMSDIHAYLDGALNEQDRQRFEEMLEVDPETAGMVRQYRQQAAELRRLYDPVMTEPVPDRMLRLLRSPAPKNAPQSADEDGGDSETGSAAQ